jgi:geranylgeranyl diphosphate synthase type I
MESKARTAIDEVRVEVKSALTDFLGNQRTYLASIASDLLPVCDALDEFLLDGGKRFRPLFGYAGLIAAGGSATQKEIKALSSLELLQACALIHDDLMDGSDTRRGKPSIHRHFENLHQKSALDGIASQFGEAAAVLLGDLALVWSDHMLNTSGLDSHILQSVHAVHDEMRIELMAGQYLDVREAGERKHSVERSLRIARYKSGKYSIERPLHMGAVMAQSKNSFETREALSAYGLPLGEAFQLRDDMLGVFGDPDVTGKPAGDDLREGKRTALIAMTLEGLDGDDQALLLAELGNPDLTTAQIEELRTLIRKSGAVEKAESLIDSLMNVALTAVQSPLITEEGRALLIAMAHAAVSRRA